MAIRVPLLLMSAFVLFIGLGIPLMRRRIPPNGWYGLRVPATMEDEVVWYEANARSGRHFVWIGCIGLALLVVLLFVPGMDTDTYVGVALAFMLAALGLALFLDVRFANRLRDRRRAHDPERSARGRPDRQSSP